MQPMQITIYKTWLPFTVKVVGDTDEVLFEQVVDFPKKVDNPPTPKSDTEPTEEK